MIKFKTILLVLLVAVSVRIVSPDELNDTTISQTEFSHDILVFNIFAQQQPSISVLNGFSEASITDVKRSIIDNLIYMLSNYHYVVIEAEERDSRIRMYNCGGETVSEGDITYWVSYNDSEDILFGPNSYNPPCECGTHVLNYPKIPSKYSGWPDTTVANDTVHYYIDIRAKVDTRTDSDTIAANLWVVPSLHYTELVDTLWQWALQDSDFTASDTWTTITKSFHLADPLIFCKSNCDTSTRVVDTLIEESYAIAAMLETTGDREVSVDWIKIYDIDGKRLVETDCYRADIEGFLRFYIGIDSLYERYLYDKPKYEYIR